MQVAKHRSSEAYILNANIDSFSSKRILMMINDRELKTYIQKIE